LGETKISLIELSQLVREGKGVSDIARKLGVTKGAVSKRLKALRVGITKTWSSGVPLKLSTVN